MVAAACDPFRGPGDRREPTVADFLKVFDDELLEAARAFATFIASLFF